MLSLFCMLLLILNITTTKLMSQRIASNIGKSVASQLAFSYQRLKIQNSEYKLPDLGRRRRVSADNLS